MKLKDKLIYPLAFILNFISLAAVGFVVCMHPDLGIHTTNNELLHFNNLWFIIACVIDGVILLISYILFIKYKVLKKKSEQVTIDKKNSEITELNDKNDELKDKLKEEKQKLKEEKQKLKEEKKKAKELKKAQKK